MKTVSQFGTVSLFNSTPGTPTSWAPPGPIAITHFDLSVNGASTTAGPDTASAILSTISPVLTVTDGADAVNRLGVVQIAIAAASTTGQTGRLSLPCYRIVQPSQVVTLKLIAWSAGVTECYAVINYVML